MNLRHVWTYLIILILPLAMSGQAAIQIRLDSLRYYKEISDTGRYYKYLHRQAKIAADSLKDKRLLDQLSGYLDPDPQSVSPGKSYYVRRVASVFGSKYLRTFSDLAQAEKYYLIAHQHVADSILLDDYAWYIENELASLYNRLDDYDKADYFRSIVERSFKHQIHTSANPLTPKQFLSRFYVNLGLLRESQGDTLEAFRAYTRGLHLADSIHYEKGIQGNASGLARMAIEMDSLDPADTYIRMAETALDSLTHEKDYPERFADTRLNKAKYLFRKSITDTSTSKGISSLSYFKEAIAILETYYNHSRHRETAKYYVAYATALLHFDSLQATGQALSKALDQLLIWNKMNDELPSKSDLYQENTLIEIFELYAAYFQKQFAQTCSSSFLHKAASSYELAIAVNDIILNKVVADPSKLVAIRINKRLVHGQLVIMYQMYQENNDELYLKTARELFTRSKSLLLDEKIKQSEIVASLSDEHKKNLREWQFKLKEAHELKLDEAYNQDSLSRIIYLLQEKIDAIYEEANVHKPIKTLTGNYIEYEVFEDEIFVMSRIAGNIHFTKLDTNAKLEPLLFRLSEYITTRGLMDDTLIQHDLYTFLIAPVTDTLPERLVIIPDAELTYIPFDLLKDDHGHMIIEQTTVSYAYQYGGPGPDTQSDEHPYEIYCLSPSYENTLETETLSEKSMLTSLPNAKAETDSIQQLFGKKAMLSSAKTDSQVFASLNSARIFHFSGHAIVEKNGAYLAMGNEAGQEYKLTMEELSLLANGPDLVVLSACETGLGKLETGEGIRSLGRSFAEAGAEAVLFTLWSVNDLSSAEIMILFYRHLLSGNDVDEALRNAKLEYLSTSGEVMQHPYYWAGFVATGEMGFYKN